MIPIEIGSHELYLAYIMTPHQMASAEMTRTPGMFQ